VATTHASIECRFSDGTTLRAYDRLVLREQFLDPLGSLSLTVQPPRSLWQQYNDRLRKGELVAVLANGKPQGVMIITTVDKVASREGLEINVEAKSVLAAAYEGSADPNYALSTTTDVPISSAVLDIMRPYGFSEVFVNDEDDVGARMGVKVGKKGAKKSILIDELKHQDCKVNESETAYGIVDRIVNRLGVICRVDVGGRLLLVRPLYDIDASYTLVQDFQLQHKGDRMVGPVQVTDTNDGQFSEVVVRGKRADKTQQTATGLPIARLGHETELPTEPPLPFAKQKLELLATGRHAYASTASPYKPKFYLDKKARDVGRCRAVCNLLHCKGARNAYVLTCTVDGWIAKTGAIWSINTVVRVICEAFGIDEDMWIFERTLMQDRSGGQQTKLKILPKHALVIGELGGS
jgi:hypothetical protein